VLLAAAQGGRALVAAGEAGEEQLKGIIISTGTSKPSVVQTNVSHNADPNRHWAWWT
jgi:hypothetical protein